MHPFNKQKHYHICKGQLGDGSNSVAVRRSRGDANKYARVLAKLEHGRTGKPYGGGCFGSGSLAFYVCGSRYVEVKVCEKDGTDHREQVSSS